MSRKPVPAQSGDRSRAELVFDRPQLMAQLFGEFDQNLLALENKLGVYITARGNKVGLEGSAEAVAQAQELEDGDVVLVMSNGDFGNIWEKLLAALDERAS